MLAFEWFILQIVDGIVIVVFLPKKKKNENENENENEKECSLPWRTSALCTPRCFCCASLETLFLVDVCTLFLAPLCQ